MFDQLSAAQVMALAVAHVRRYEFRVNASSHRANHGEYDKYLAIWRGILVKVKRSPQWRLLLSKEEKREIREAVESGGFDELLRATAEPLS
jgi:hypothetical protein